MSDLLGNDREPGSDRPLAEQFRFDAGTVALNLLATLGFRGTAEPVERLESVSRLRAWLAASGLPVVPVVRADLGELRHLRETGYAVLSAVAGAGRPPRAAVRRLGESATRPRPPAALVVDERGVHWHEPPPTFESVLAGLARALADHAVDDAEQLRLCDAPGCSMVYLDVSRGHRRRWCSMSRCGNSAKAARHRARAGTDGSADRPADPADDPATEVRR